MNEELKEETGAETATPAEPETPETPAEPGADEPAAG